MRIRYFNIIEILFYPVLINPFICMLFIYIFLYWIFLSCFNRKSEWIKNKLYIRYYIDGRQFKDFFWEEIFLFILLIPINTIWWDNNKSRAYIDYLKKSWFPNLKHANWDDEIDVRDYYNRYLKYKINNIGL